MLYQIKFLLPTESRIFEIEANNKEDAVQNAHEREVPFGPFRGLVYWIDLEDGLKEQAWFNLIQVDGEELVSRIFYRGIYRGSGYRTKQDAIISLQNIVAKLGWKHRPELLLENWE